MGPLAHALATGSLVLALAGCGGGSGEPGGKLDEAFRGKVEGICAFTAQQISAQPPLPFKNFDPASPDPKLLPRVGRHLQSTVTIRQTITIGFNELGDPARGTDVWEELRSTAVEAQETQIRAIQAAVAGDAANYTGAQQAAEDLRARLADILPRAGFEPTTTCLTAL